MDHGSFFGRSDTSRSFTLSNPYFLGRAQGPRPRTSRVSQEPWFLVWELLARNQELGRANDPCGCTCHEQERQQYARMTLPRKPALSPATQCR